MPKTKNRYFAQDNNLDAFNYRAKHFPSFNDAVNWLKSRSGGTIKKRVQPIASVKSDGLIVHFTRKTDWE